MWLWIYELFVLSLFVGTRGSWVRIPFLARVYATFPLCLCCLLQAEELRLADPRPRSPWHFLWSLLFQKLILNGSKPEDLTGKKRSVRSMTRLTVAYSPESVVCCYVAKSETVRLFVWTRKGQPRLSCIELIDWCCVLGLRSLLQRCPARRWITTFVAD